MIKVLGITDERTDCECCGRSGLKRTVALDFESEVRYYGVDCAAMTVYGAKTRRNANKIVVEAGAYVREQQQIATAKSARVKATLADALYAYIGTRRQMEQRAHYSHDDRHVVVDLTDAKDVAWYEQNGFTCVNVFPQTI